MPQCHSHPVGPFERSTHQAEMPFMQSTHCGHHRDNGAFATPSRNDRAKIATVLTIGIFMPMLHPLSFGPIAKDVLCAWKASLAHVVCVGCDRGLRLLPEFSVALDEFRPKVREHAKRVVDHQDLAITG